MKRILSVALVAIFLSTSATAQNVNIGVKAGVNVFNLEDENDFDYKSRTNFNGGLLGHIHLGPQFGLQPEVMFSGQGAKSKALGTDAELKLSYINVPVLFQYMFDNGFRLQAGPQVGFLVKAESEIGDVENDVKDDFKTVDFAVTAGVSYVHPPSGFGVDARYNLGLTDITEGAGDLKNKGFQVGVFYLFKHRN